jgi:class 3 adenylate cyclase/tetratricopeptide (TPR) repeat protein
MREQRKVVTIIFCDLVGSTALGESTDPEALRARMRLYFEDLRTVLERHSGTVEKFVGDAVMAVFGIPVSHEDDALRAVRAAAEMRDAIAEHRLEARIGINSGEVVVGGEGETLVTGDAVNVAARLEQAAAPGETLIGAETLQLVRDAVRVEPVEPLELKGKSQPVEAFRLVEVIADAAALARHPETPLVGRARERERLWRDYEDAVADRSCRLFTLLGPAGIGKSRLVADFLERVEGSADVLRGRCLSYGEGITYWPLVEMLVPIGVDPEGIVGSTPEETRVAFRRLLEERGRVRPQVVVVDDLQWAEPVFVDLVEHVADLSRDAPVVLLCIARTELLDTRPDWGGGKLNATSLLLEPLDAEECALLIDRLVPDVVLAPELRERINAASAGNPLFVEEMLAMVREHADGRGEVAVPPTIQALLQARIDALGDAVRVVLERAAIEGEVFHRGAVAELAADEVGSDLELHLSSLVRMELVRPAASLVPGEDAYRFRHLLIRDAAYGAMPKEQRARLHERFADWLESSAGAPAFERDEILGYHLEQSYRLRAELGTVDAELATRAGSRLVCAGKTALSRADSTAAKGLLERGNELLGDGDPMRLEALIDLSRALSRLGELERSELVLRSAIADAGRVGNVPLEARARLALNSIRVRIYPEASVEDELREALEIASTLEQLGDRSGLAAASFYIGMCRFMLGRGGDGVVDLDRAAELARETGDDVVRRAALGGRLRPMAYGPTPASDGVAYCDVLVESDFANVSDKAQALQVRALLLAMLGDFVASRSSSARALALIEEYELTLTRGTNAIDVGLAELLAGDLDRSERVLRGGHDLLVAIGDTGTRSSVDAILSDVLFLRGRDDEALVLADESRAIAAADDFDAQPRWRGARARVLSRRGDHEGALELVREAHALLEPSDFIGQHAYVCDVHGEVLAASGRVDEAVVAVEQAIAFHEQKGNVVSAGRSRAALGDLRSVRRS